MAMSASSMVSRIQANLSAIANSDGSSAGATTMHNEALLAFCQGVIDEIKTNAQASGSDPQGGTVTSTIA